jgi:hypothetical protein
MIVAFCPSAYPPAHIERLERLDLLSNPGFINYFIHTPRYIVNHHEEPTNDSIFPGSKPGDRQLVRGYLSGIDWLLLMIGKIPPSHYNPPISIKPYRRYSGDYPTGFV